jgi:hypothetical protein
LTETKKGRMFAVLCAAVGHPVLVGYARCGKTRYTGLISSHGHKCIRTFDGGSLKATSFALIQILPLPVFAYLTVCVRTPIVVSYVVPYALVVCVIASPIARSNRTPRLVDHRLMTLIEQTDRMLGRGYRSGRCAQNE